MQSKQSSEIRTGKMSWPYLSLVSTYILTLSTHRKKTTVLLATIFISNGFRKENVYIWNFLSFYRVKAIFIALLSVIIFIKLAYIVSFLKLWNFIFRNLSEPKQCQVVEQRWSCLRVLGGLSNGFRILPESCISSAGRCWGSYQCRTNPQQHGSVWQGWKSILVG